MALLRLNYSGNVYDAASAGTVDFPLTTKGGSAIRYLDKSHIHAYTSSDNGITWSEVARPAVWDFDSSGTIVRFKSAPGTWVRVQRLTPYTARYTTFQDSSLLTAEQLNDGEDFSLFVDQELADLTGFSWSSATDTVDTADQKAGRWVSDDKHVATTGALSERFDVIMSDTRPPDPTATEGRQPGKFWVDTAGLSINYWDPTAKAWINTAGSGPIGPTGPQGPQGATGPQGIQGVTGLQGPVGPQGPQGLQGATGAKGDRGADGSPGAQGPQGARGPAGPGITLMGSVPTAADLPAGAANGDAYITTDTGHVHVWDGLKWVDAGLIRGPEGPQGPQGIPGAQGPQGATGPQGVAGTPGAKGDAGAQGPAGPQGPQGVQGPAGVGLVFKGQVASAANLPPNPLQNDAWQTVDTGHVHVWDNTQWIDLGLIRGPEGPAGPTGATGAQGPQGVAGAQGAKGDTGPAGPTGPQGLQGLQGPMGLTGPQGATGATGATGPAINVASLPTLP